MIDRARAVARAAAGWLTDAEGELLFRLAAACPPSASIVEIGSWHGKSTIFLASGARLVGGRVLAIDPHERSFENPAARTLSIMQTNLVNAGVADVVTPIVARSEAAIDRVSGRYHLLFIDGDHTAPAVRRDLHMWFPNLHVGGTLALHDVISPACSGPRRELARMLWRSRALGRVRFVDSIAYARKVEANTPADRVANAWAAFALAAYELRPSGMPAPVARVLNWLAGFTPLKRHGRRSRGVSDQRAGDS